MERLGIYIHWPYCKSKCPYCDFFSRVKKDVDQQQLVTSYLDDLEYYRGLNDNYQVETIFFGGGTPSLLEPRQIERIIDKIALLWPCAENMEISLEANPNTDDGHLFADLRTAGINRLSLGVQALSAGGLKFLGRTHTLNQALSSIDSVLENFENHSIDLIYARPEQKAEEWEKELQAAVSFGVRHLSLYQLTIEENTVFARKGVRPADDETALELFSLSENLLAANGYRHYEVSNYAFSGFECRHNLGYWQGYDYVGIGNGGIGRIRDGQNLLHTFYPRCSEPVLPQERAEELVIMGLRLANGINKQRFIRQCGIDFASAVDTAELEKLVKDGLLFDDAQTVCATPDGMQVLNYIIERLCSL
uniref:Heme chaperone HemW n=1 Tax=uncultured Alphaproteobacteria bacterium TaxID=91750 RepID=A0A6G8F3B0_9PROT|nr:coproporphyrinogen III oxidase [uncultured Alphaproteobacteria bacterium]